MGIRRNDEWENNAEKAEIELNRLRQQLNKKRFLGGVFITALIMLTGMTLGIIRFGFFKGFLGAMVIWLLTLMFFLRPFYERKGKQKLFKGFLAGAIIVDVPALLIYLILIFLGQKESVANVFGFIAGLASCAIINAILSVIFFAETSKLDH
jgi:cation transport ATPase